jgi:RimJ/RimL family protein N-acetyltransferase
MYFKKLIGRKCYLSPMNVNDAEKYTEWLNDLEVMKHFSLYSSIISLENEKEALIKLTKEHNYSIINLETNELIGSCGFMDIDHINQTAEIGIFIGNKYLWNQGYGTEAFSLLIDYGFKALNFHNIMLRVYENNKNAIKCYEKVGFKKIGIRREALKRNLKRQNIVYMDIMEKDFFEKN